MRFPVGLSVGVLVGVLAFEAVALAQSPGLPFTEDFSTDVLKDTARTTADWSTADGKLRMALSRTRTSAFAAGTFAALFPADADYTFAIALGDVDGDGDLDVVAGNFSGFCQVYFNNGTSDPYNGYSSQQIDTVARQTRSLALGDVDGDGDLDLVVGNANPGTPESSYLYLNNGTASAFNGVVGIPVTSTSSPPETRAVALGDLNGDRRLDLVVGNGLSAPSFALINNGTANPYDGVTPIAIDATTYDTYTLTLADVDLDGDLDIVMGNNNPGFVRLYRNTVSLGSFAPDAGVNVTDAVRTAPPTAVGDLNGDGRPDLVVGGYGSAKIVYFHNQSSTPYTGVTPVTVAADAYHTWSVALGDVDGDGDLDLVSGEGADANDDVNRLYLNNGTSTPFAGAVGTQITADAHKTMGIALGDMDSDGDLDLVVGNYGQVNRLYLNRASANPFVGATAAVPADTGNAFAAAAGDVDNDGDLDVVAGVDGVNRLYLNGGGADPFGAVTGLNITADNATTQAIALGDMDGDGDLDVVAGNVGRDRLYLNNGTADPFNAVAGSDISILGVSTTDLAIGDVDLDGDLDLVIASTNSSYVYTNNGTADPFSGVSAVNMGTATLISAMSIALGDVDGDGDLDAVVGRNGLPPRLFVNGRSSSCFTTASVEIGIGTPETRDVVLADIDGDGDLDLVAANYNATSSLYLNNGTSTPFASVAGVDITSDTLYAYAAAAADCDHDGDLDLVIGCRGGMSRLYLNNGTADPFAGVSGVDIGATVYQTCALAAGDFDGDGWTDLFAVTYGEGSKQYLNLLDAGPLGSLESTVVSGGTTLTHAMALGDYDRDGDLDLATCRSGSLIVYPNEGTPAPFGSAICTIGLRNFTSLAAGDVDRDGDSDLVGGSNATVVYCPNEGEVSRFGTIVDLTACGGTVTDVALADMDGDGDLDIVASVVNAPSQVFFNNGTATPFGTAGVDITSDAGTSYACAVGDLDSDGDMDVVIGNWSGFNRLYLNNGSSTPFNGISGSDIGTSALRTVSLALGDVDGDGDLDVAMGCINASFNRLFFNNGTSDPFNGVSATNITNDAHTTYGIALADLDADGDLDVVAVNELTANRIYLNNGTASPFAAVSGIAIGVSSESRLSVAAADVDRDGRVEILTGGNGSGIYLFRRAQRYDLSARGRGTSIAIDGVAGGIPNAAISAPGLYPQGTSVAHYLSNDGGAHWYCVRNGTSFFFPDPTGSDLRWRLALSSISPTMTPTVDAVIVTADLTPPTVVSITRITTTPTSATTVQFLVTFSEEVSGIDASDFVVTGSGMTGDVTGVVLGEEEATVTVGNITGLGDIGLDLDDDDTIVDAVGLPLGGAGVGNGDFTTGDTIEIVAPPAPSGGGSSGGCAAGTASASLGLAGLLVALALRRRGAQLRDA